MRFERAKHPADVLVNLNIRGPRGQQAFLFAAVVLPAAFLWGCAGVVSGQSTQPPAATYAISGTITPAAGGGGATVTLSGAAGATTTTDGAGNYSFTGLASGNYAVTPSHTGFAFSPTSQSVTLSGNVSGVNFTATTQAAHSVALTWNASTTSTVTGYNVYRSTVSGAGYIKISTSLVASLNYTDTTVQSATTYYYVTTAVDTSGAESAFSNEVPAVIP